MHELSYTQNAYQLVMVNAKRAKANSVVKVFLRVGAFHEILGSYVKKYWKQIAVGSIAENAIIEIEEIPISCKCISCERVYYIDKYKSESWNCPECGKPGSIFTGMEMEVAKIEIE